CFIHHSVYWGLQRDRINLQAERDVERCVCKHPEWSSIEVAHHHHRNTLFRNQHEIAYKADVASAMSHDAKVSMLSQEPTNPHLLKLFSGGFPHQVVCRGLQNSLSVELAV